AGERGSAAPSHGSPGAADPGARSSPGVATSPAATPGEVGGRGLGSTEETPALAATGPGGVDRVTAGAGPAHPDTATPFHGDARPEGALDLSTRPSAFTEGGSAPVPPPSQSEPAGVSSVAQPPSNAAAPAPGATAGAGSTDHASGSESSGSKS